MTEADAAPLFEDRVVPPDWDDAYANQAHVPEAEAIFAAWMRDAADFRNALADRARLGLSYAGPTGGARERFDLFLPEGAPRGLVLYVHGGYWVAFGPEGQSHLAAGPLARGWAVAMPSYALAPSVRISEITRQVSACLAAAAAEVSGPIRVSGHSAGGHLATRMLCGAAPAAAADRIERCVSISGLHDLRPLRRTALNEKLRLTAEEAAAESPALLTPVEGARATAWVGADERPEFLRQSALLANVWAGLGAETRLAVAPGRHHFDVIAGLAEADSPLTRELCGDD